MPAESATGAPAFCLSQHEVTQSEYLEFLTATHYAAPATWPTGTLSPAEELYPVTGVTKTDAEAYCTWRGQQSGVVAYLPSSDQLRRAASGASLTPRATDSPPVLQPVGSDPLDWSEYGACDLLGNAEEWTSDLVPTESASTSRGFRLASDLVTQLPPNADDTTSTTGDTTIDATPRSSVTISATPASKVVASGDAFTLTAAFRAATPFITIQWFKDGIAIPGATSAVFQVAAASMTDGGAYRAKVVWLDTNYSDSSNALTMTVIAGGAAPSITKSPTSQSVTTGQSVTLQVEAQGTPAPTYQWLLNGNTLSGATSASLTIANASSSDAGSYTVTATNALGSVTSSSATLTVKSSTVATSSGGGGGGAPSFWFMILLLAGTIWRALPRRSQTA